MKELTCLTAKDAPYFYKLAEEGAAVVIEIELDWLLACETLSDLNLHSQTKQPKSAEAALTAADKDVADWFEEKGAKIKKYCQENLAMKEELIRSKQRMGVPLNPEEESYLSEMQKNQQDAPAAQTAAEKDVSEQKVQPEPLDALTDYLVNHELSDEVIDIINDGIRNGITEQQIVTLLQKGLNPKKMKLMCEIYVKNNAKLQ